MCGIFGLVLRKDAAFSHSRLQSTLSELFKLSETRGKESSGIHAYVPDQRASWGLKSADRATDLMKSPEYASIMQALAAAFEAEKVGASLAVIAHSRLVTNGTSALPQNNQPVSREGVTLIHNGIVVNVDELWASHPELQRHAEVDTEFMGAFLAQHGGASTPAKATADVFALLKGAASIAWVHGQTDRLVLATNTGDLYFHLDERQGVLVFASEQYILDNVVKHIHGEAAVPAVRWLEPQTALGVGINNLGTAAFRLDEATAAAADAGVQVYPTPVSAHQAAPARPATPVLAVGSADFSLLRYNEDNLKKLRRCSRCILPETFPFIAFDGEGVCNYCRSYKPRYAGMHPVKTKHDFIESLAGYRRGNGRPDVLVPFSGGRDSSYGLHLIKHEFGLNPITFTYDWGMVTDLARRNVARMCGQLGVQNILVSADIKQKRENVRKNVAAWLKKPDLGMVPLFMAGDKHFFRIVNQLKRQTGISLDLWSANPLENTDFKSGFCGVSPDFDKSRVDYLSMSRKLHLAAYYGSRFLTNPGYINTSLLDTMGAFLAYYVEPRRDFYFIFDHMIWEENEVNDVLLNQYDWELAPDTDSTWRIGDGTAPFYNYIYMTARGFSEFDTFRSNQIREGMMTREEAISAVYTENRPRPQSIKWYLDTIGIDFDSAIRRINEMDVMGLHR
ncbi:TPA: hypothetical protein ACKP5X_000732 [Stenotrophomonas maltophilia]|uniref:hypothetical protein n=1 Tax=Stenotrophomonas maltophilia group TaxID=995085 RepID=UPI001311C171|nr:hypothetical protein [Stenotrophomonas maltophilia]MBA0434502.1 hypothetical protein [Stenotrophomonas maltophilia]MDZ5816670.1 hypothetical protein [Stenotrophomonas maltophilia]HDS1674763.1 hypothetical protein [Stenotrophomonas maltophilia]HEL3813760.1 hypothetical protein [Stenotrophomonas maltophilia]